MANEENIKPHEFTSEQNREEAAKNGAKGGKASGEARRRRKTLREIADLLADRKIQVPMPDGEKEEMTYDVAMIATQYRKAIVSGNVDSAKFLAELRGELRQQVDMNVTQIKELTKEEAEALYKELDAKY